MSYAVPAHPVDSIPLPPGVTAVKVIDNLMTGRKEVWWRVKDNDTIHNFELPEGESVDDTLRTVYAAIRLTC